MPGADRLVPTYLVKLNNQRLPPEMSADLQAIVIEEHLNCPAMFLLTFSRQKQCWCAHKDLSIGSSVVIELGYLNGTKQVIDGEITGDGAEYSSFSPAYTTVKGYDRLHRLARRHITRTFRDMKDWQIAQQIAEEAHLAADIQDKAGEPHAYVVQNGLQDLAFLLERAKRAGREIGVNGKNLFWRKPAEDLEPVAVLEWGKSLREFSVNVTGMGEKSEVIVRGMDPKTQQAIVWREERRADMPFGRAREVVIDNSVKSVAEAENLAKAVLREKQMEYMKAEGSCLGNPDIHVGQTLMIKGVADKVAGKYYIVWVEHELNGEEGYITRFRLKRAKPYKEKANVQTVSAKTDTLISEKPLESPSAIAAPTPTPSPTATPAPNKKGVQKQETPSKEDKIRRYKKAIAAALKNPDNLPKNGETRCNMFAADVATRMGNSDLGSGKVVKTADEQYNFVISHPQFWKEVAAEEAQALANEGNLVLGLAPKDASGHGHSTVVAPEGKLVQSGKWGPVPQVYDANTNIPSQPKGANWCYGEKKPSFFTPL